MIAATTTPPTTTSPEPSHRRNGLVARLPKAARDRLNHLMLDGLTYKAIIEALGPDGETLTENSLSTWHAGGYQDWLRNQQRIDEYRAKFELALDLVTQKPNTVIQEAGRQIVSAQLCDLLLSFDASHLAATLTEKPELYPRLVNALARICEGEVAVTHRHAQGELLRAKLATEQAKSSPKVASSADLDAIAHKINLL